MLQVENEKRAELPAKQGSSPEQTSVLEESIFKISGQLSTISRNQKYFRTRENRNFSTVASTEKRIVNFSMIQIGLIICMGALQVFVVRFFFQVWLTLIPIVVASVLHGCYRVQGRDTYELGLDEACWIYTGAGQNGGRHWSQVYSSAGAVVHAADTVEDTVLFFCCFFCVEDNKAFCRCKPFVN
jgi:hypothetical protein